MYCSNPGTLKEFVCYVFANVNRFPLCKLFCVHVLECSVCQSVWVANQSGEREGLCEEIKEGGWGLCVCALRELCGECVFCKLFFFRSYFGVGYSPTVTRF